MGQGMQMTQSKGGIAAAFAAGLAGGGVGGDQIAQQEIDAANGRTEAVQAIVEQIDATHPTIKTYVRNAAIQTVNDVLDARLPPSRAMQLGQLADDIAPDITEGEIVALSGLSQRLAEKIDPADPLWLVWYSTNFDVYLSSQISTGVAVGNLSYDQLVRVKDVTDVMQSVATTLTPDTPAIDTTARDEQMRQIEKNREERAKRGR